MTLSRSCLEPNRSHSWSEPDADGWRTCEHNGCRVRWWWVEAPDHPPRSVCYGGLSRSGLKRSKGVRPQAEREKRAHQKDEELREFVRRQPCVAFGHEPPNQCAHVRSRGAGWGDWIDGAPNVVSLCATCHRSQHQRGIETFQYDQGVNLKREAKELGERYQQEEAA